MRLKRIYFWVSCVESNNRNFISVNFLNKVFSDIQASNFIHINRRNEFHGIKIVLVNFSLQFTNLFALANQEGSLLTAASDYGISIKPPQNCGDGRQRDINKQHSFLSDCKICGEVEKSHGNNSVGYLCPYDNIWQTAP